MSSLSNHWYFAPSTTGTTSSSTSTSLSRLGPGSGASSFSSCPTVTTLQALESACDIASQVMDLLGFEDDTDTEDDESEERGYYEDRQ